MSHVVTAAAAVFAAVAAWLAVATLGFTGAGAVRLAVLPISMAAGLCAAAAAAAVALLLRRGASPAPLALLLILILPWLPIDVPAAFLLWTGPLASLVWGAVLLLMIASLPARPDVPGLVRGRPRTVAALIACAIFGLSAWRVAPMVPGGDEPHYLIITQSLLLDRSLTIEDVHRRRDYLAYYPVELQPHVQRRGLNGRIYSIHAPGLPALVAPAFALGGYHAVVVFLVLLASLASALAWHLAWLTTRRTDAAWFGWAAVTLPVTAIFHSFTIYPDGIGGILTLTGVWALLRADQEARGGTAEAARPWLLHGAALAMLPWMHSRFAVLAALLGALILLRLGTTKNPAGKAVAFLCVPAVSAILWVGYFVAIYGRPDPSSAYGPGEIGSFSFVPGGLGGLLFDQRFGLITYAPVMALAIAGLIMMLWRRENRRLALELLFVVIPYLTLVTHFAMWWGGWSPPARFFAAVLPLFAIPAAAAWTFVERPASRTLAVTSVALTACASAIVVGVDRGRLAFNTRDTPSLWFEWLGRLTDIPGAAPSWTRDADLPLFRAIAIWLVVAIAVYVLLRSIEGRFRATTRAAFHTVSVAALAVGIMVASSVVWAVQGTSGVTASSSQLELLETTSSVRRALALQLNPPSRIELAAVPGRLRIELTRPLSPRRAGRETAPLFALPPLPAGTYRLTVIGDDPRGWVMVGITRDARDPFALHTLPLPARPLEVQVPVSLRALVVRGDEEAWRTVRGLLVEPVSVTPPAERITRELARRAVRYERHVAYFLDEKSFPEPQAFWIGGSRESSLVVQADSPRPRLTLTLRNAPVDNQVTVESGGWKRVLEMRAGEEQRVEVPMAPGRAAAPLRISAGSGFRPSDHDPASRDDRFLGVWVKIEPD
jgi:hypothetical protein